MAVNPILYIASRDFEFFGVVQKPTIKASLTIDTEFLFVIKDLETTFNNANNK